MSDREALKARNLDFFHRASPELHRRLTGIEPTSEIVFDGAGRADVVTGGHGRYGGDAKAFAGRQLDAFWQAPGRFELKEPKPYPVPGQFFDAYTNRFLKDALDRAEDAGIRFLGRPRTEKAYFLVVFGVGLGQHIDDLVARTECLYLMLAEPNLETLWHSLEVYDWAALADGIHGRGGSVNFIFDTTPEALAGSVIAGIRLVNPSAVDGCVYFVHEDSTLFRDAVALIGKEILAAFAQIGQFYDETLMLANTHANLGSGTEKVYAAAGPGVDAPAFVVGSGRSLDEALPFLRANADKAVIISSGSAFRPLMVNGIRPDFQVELENVDIMPVLSQVTDTHDVSDICLVAASSVEPAAADAFGTVVYFFRPYLTPYPMFCETDAHCLKDPDPTVVNAGLSFAQGAGFRDIYLFGVDMGARDPADHHASDTYHYTADALDDASVYDLPVPGNFGGTCMTSVGMYLARGNLIRAIAEDGGRHRHVNCSDGARIDGAEPMPVDALDLAPIGGGKAAAVTALIGGFPVFTGDRLNAGWDSARLAPAVDAFLDEVLAQLRAGAPFRDKRYLTRMMALLGPNLEPAEILADRTQGVVRLLFRGTLIMLLIVFEYYLNRAGDDDQADAFARIGLDRLTAMVEHLRALALNLIADPASGRPPEDDRSGTRFFHVPATERPAVPVPRNAPCPCGSGRKYKHCHGRAA